MTCLKCGREMDAEQAFCEACLQEMEKYPVKPGIAIQLPVRKAAPAARKPVKKRSVSPEEQIHRLKRRVWFLSGILVVTLALIAAMVYPTVTYFSRNYNLRPGQNYHTETVSTTPSTLPTETVDPFEGMAE